MIPFMEHPTETLQRLGVDPAVGLSDTQVAESRAAHGSNTFTQEKPASLPFRILESMKVLELLYASAEIQKEVTAE